MTAGKVLWMSVWDRLKNHQQGYQQKPDLTFSNSMTEFLGKIHSTAYRTIKAHHGNRATTKPDNQNSGNQNRNELRTVYRACVLRYAFQKDSEGKDKKKHGLKT